MREIDRLGSQGVETVSRGNGFLLDMGIQNA